MWGDVPASQGAFTLIECDEDTADKWEVVAWRYRQYHHALHGFFAKRVNNPSDVSDLVQKVFVRVLQRNSDAPIENTQAYLFQVAANVLTDEYRRSRVRLATEHDTYDEDRHGQCCDISPERILLAEEAVDQVAALIRQLPEATRDVYILRVHQEYEFADIATMLGISKRGAQRHMARALKQLEKVVEGDVATSRLV